MIRKSMTAVKCELKVSCQPYKDMYWYIKKKKKSTALDFSIILNNLKFQDLNENNWYSQN